MFVVAEIDAKDGSFGIVPKNLSGTIVSSHYFVFDLDTEQIIPEYFDYLIRFAPYTEMIHRYVKGTTNYSAIRPKHILDLKIPLPPIEIQQIIVTRLSNQTNIIENAKKTIKAVKEGITDISDFEGDYEYKEIQDVCVSIQAGGYTVTKKA
ncbi:MAG: restriction endonuclease subunit S [Thaumarchaeota archaeon]|nr:restriction endonuclease subunit S [Nitrososphaerota archaeon]